VVLAFPRNSGQVFVTATEAGVGRTVTTWKTEQEGVRYRSGATFRRSDIKNPYEFWGWNTCRPFRNRAALFSRRDSHIDFLCQPGLPLGHAQGIKLRTTGFWGCLPEAPADPGGSMHLDAETRSFQNRPSYGPPLWQVLRVVVSTAAAIAALKIGQILAVYFIRG